MTCRLAGAKLSEILIEFYIFSSMKMHLILSSGIWRPFCLGLNVLRSGGAYMCQWGMSSLVQIMTGCRVVAKPLSKPCLFLANWVLKNGIQSTFYQKCISLHLRKCIWIYYLQYDDHFDPGQMSNPLLLYITVSWLEGNKPCNIYHVFN